MAAADQGIMQFVELAFDLFVLDLVVAEGVGFQRQCSNEQAVA